MIILLDLSLVFPLVTQDLHYSEHDRPGRHRGGSSGRETRDHQLRHFPCQRRTPGPLVRPLLRGHVRSLGQYEGKPTEMHRYSVLLEVRCGFTSSLSRITFNFPRICPFLSYLAVSVKISLAILLCPLFLYFLYSLSPCSRLLLLRQGATAGLFFSLVVNIWMVIGRFLVSGKRPVRLPLSTDGCLDLAAEAEAGVNATLALLANATVDAVATAALPRPESVKQPCHSFYLFCHHNWC